MRSSEIYTASAKSILKSVRLRKPSGIAYCAFSLASGALLLPQASEPHCAVRCMAASYASRAPAGPSSGGISYPCRVVNCLLDLDAAAMTVHIAEAADVHQDVEAELLPGAEGAQHFVMAATMAQASVDDFLASGSPSGLRPRARIWR